LAWVSTESARLIGLKDYGLSAGSWADFIVLDAESPAAVIAEIAQPLMGFKRGRQTFKQEKARLLNVPK
jgi:cytosine deaminase